MKISEILSEGLSPSLFHYTDGNSAMNILKTGAFELSATDDETFRQPEENEPPFYLSTARTVTGEYHMNGSNLRRSDETAHVMFNLDGRFYANNHKGGQIVTKDVEYDNDGNPIPSTYNQAGSRAEAEDRIWSNKPSLGLGGVTSIHVLVLTPPKKKKSDMAFASGITDTNGFVKNIVALAQHRQIPIFVYSEPKYWLAQSHRHANRY